MEEMSELGDTNPNASTYICAQPSVGGMLAKRRDITSHS